MTNAQYFLPNVIVATVRDHLSGGGDAVALPSTEKPFTKAPEPCCNLTRNA